MYKCVAHLLLLPFVPTQTSTQISTRESQPTISQISYQLPAWLKDPHTIILMDLVAKSRGPDTTYTLSFFNASTGERYNLLVPANTRIFFWLNAMHFGLLSNDLQTVHIVDIETGQMSSAPAPQQSTQSLDGKDDRNALLVRQDPSNAGNLTFEYANQWPVEISKDGDYSAVQNDEEERPIIITNLKNGKIVWQSNPSEGYQYNEYVWSPAKDSYLAFVEGKPDAGNFGFPVIDTTLSILDVATGQIVSSIQADVGPIVWSPDGTKILYTNALSLYRGFGYGFKGTPYIFNIQTGEKQGIWNISQRAIPAGYVLTTTADYRWSLDGKSIYLTYEYGSPTGMTTGRKGSFCIYQLGSGSFTCPLDHLMQVPQWPGALNNYGWNIEGFDLSPDGQFAHFCLSSNSHLSDDQSGPSTNGLIKLDGTGFFSWYSTTDGQDFYSCSFDKVLWRPLH